jgi:glycosyltransferase involved in cell wall biosynthesis
MKWFNSARLKLKLVIGDIGLGIRLLKREGPGPFLRRTWMYLKGRRLNTSQKKQFEGKMEIPDHVNFSKEKSRISPSFKILFISHNAHLGGAQILFLSLLRWFNSHTAIDIRIICNEGGIFLDQFREIAETMVYSDLERKFHSNKEKLSEILNFCNGKPDLIYSNSVAGGRNYHLLQALEVPIITHVHELQMSINHYAGEFIDDVIGYSEFYIAASNAVAENLKNSFNIPKDKIKVVHAFIEDVPVHSISSETRRALRKKLGLDENKFLIIGCGIGLFWRKGADLFIDVVNQLNKTILDNSHFYWVGTFSDEESQPRFGTWESHLNLIRKYGLENHITFLGVKENVGEYLKAGDLFLLPSREDPFPLVCLEAAQNGLPVICFKDAGGMPEFVEEDAGFVVPFEDTKTMAQKIETLYNNPKLLSQLGKRALQKVNSRHITPVALPKILSICRKVSGKNPKVSVIVPNYNYGRFLEKRLDSILQQTFKDFEIIILDDASSDTSQEIINQFSLTHEVAIRINKKNSGSVFKQWYKGLSVATGDFVWMAEADDLSDPRFLEKMLPFMNDDHVSLAYCNSKVIDESGNVHDNFYIHNGYYDNLPGGKKWNQSYVCQGNIEMDDGLGVKNIIPNASAVLFRRSSLLNINQEELFSFRCGGDWYVYLNSIKFGKIAYNPEQLNYHRRHSQSVVGRSLNSAEETIPDYYKIHKYVIENFHINEITLSKQAHHVLTELRAIWPNVTDEDYRKLYDSSELKRIYNFQQKN